MLRKADRVRLELHQGAFQHRKCEFTGSRTTLSVAGVFCPLREGRRNRTSDKKWAMTEEYQSSVLIAASGEIVRVERACQCWLVGKRGRR